MSPIAAAVVAALVVLALLALFGSLLLSRRLRGLSASVDSLTKSIDTRRAGVPDSVSTASTRLAEAGTDAERLLWSLTALDVRIDGTQAKLVAGREGLDALRRRLADNHTTLTRLRGSTRLVLRALEMRRTFLG